MKNKSIEEQIRSILLNNNEWDAFDDEVEDGYVSVEYHKETLDEVIKQILSLIEKSNEEAVRKFIWWFNSAGYIKTKIPKHTVYNYFNERDVIKYMIEGGINE